MHGTSFSVLAEIGSPELSDVLHNDRALTSAKTPKYVARQEDERLVLINMAAP